MKFTIIGGRGFVGSRLTQLLTGQGHQVWSPAKDAADLLAQDLGDVFYCAGTTADARTRPFDTVRAHVGALAPLLESGRFGNFVYLSSTRLYLRATRTDELAALPVVAAESEELFAASKLAGEALCAACGRQGVRVARLSNIVGENFDAPDFLPSILRDIVSKRELTLFTTPDSSKDYLLLDDAVWLLIRICLEGRQSVYNVATGRNLSNQDLLAALARIPPFKFTYSEGARRVVFPAIDIQRVREEFGFSPAPVLPALPALVEAFRRHAAGKSPAGG